MKTPGALTQAQVMAVCKGALGSGAKKVTVEATLPNGTTLKVTAHADDLMAANQSNGSDEQDTQEIKL